MTYISEVFVEPMRIGNTSATLEVLFTEPLIFAAPYATVTDVVDRPEEFEAKKLGVKQKVAYALARACLLKTRVQSARGRKARFLTRKELDDSDVALLLATNSWTFSVVPARHLPES